MNTSLDQIAALARALVDAQSAVTAAEDTLTKAKEHARALSEDAIPAALQELGLTEIRLETGERISCKLDVYASIPVASRAQAYAWLEEHAFGGLIKTEVSTAFGKGELESATALYERLQAEGLQANLAQTVAPQTLKAWLREQLAAGTTVPMELFGARPIWTTKLVQK